MTERQTIAVLGTGHLGRAVAERLSRYHNVLTWTRSGGTDPAPAVRRADLVLLTLFDGAACRDVLAGCRSELAERTVVNLASVAPDEAVEFEQVVSVAGGAYLHSPVIGSVSAAKAGTLTLLAGCTDLTSVPDALDLLGERVMCSDPRSAARAKLVANGVLADSLLTLGAAVERGAAAGLDTVLVLEVLQHTGLGALVRAKRRWLEDDPAPTQFAVRALEKDVRLLVDMAPTAAATLAALKASGAGADQDIATVSFRVSRQPRDLDPESQLTIAAPCDDDSLLAPLVAYARGHATGDPRHFRAAFRPTAHVEGIRDGVFVSWDLDAYCNNFGGSPAPNEPTRRRTITELRGVGTVAYATMVLQHDPDVFTDIFVLVREAAGWRIANKVYDRASGAT